ncbi:uncharacterized protein A4U43_C07F26620 [Asparagus officinalis]|uniref:Uncharacterized protein n=1 Tax=Asparagus officinalis TaxID=4686 RepID=A0A5P1EKB6_ASPOF|nr:uncharacterized protein A4U43_C07F26620 [Asparagus officinalis]
MAMGKELILLDQENPYDEEKVDYEVDTDAYFIEPDDAAIKGDIGRCSHMLVNDKPNLETMDGAALPTSGEFEPKTDFTAQTWKVVDAETEFSLSRGTSTINLSPSGTSLQGE